MGRRGASKPIVSAGLLALWCAVLACSYGPMVSSGAAAGCPNEAIREAQTSEALPNGTTYLPACMALEMASPPKKFGQEASELSAFSPSGARTLFTSKAALSGTPGLQAFLGDSYVASRGSSGWSLTPTSPPASTGIAVGGATAGGPYAFDSGLDGWVLFGSSQRQKEGGEGQILHGEADGASSPLSPLLVPIDNSGADLQFTSALFSSSGTAADLSATVFPAVLATTSLLPGDPSPSFERNSYVAFVGAGGEAELQLLGRDQAGKVWGGRCGARLGFVKLDQGAKLNQGAISADGSRIYMTTRPAQAEPSVEEKAKGEFPACNAANPLRILERTGESPEIKELIPGGPASGDDFFQGASQDGSKVFFTTPRALTASDHDSGSSCSATVGASVGCDLYLYDADLLPGTPVIQVSAGEDVAGKHETGKEANVLSSVTSISADGSHIYFAAQGVLSAAANPEGATPVVGKPNLYVYERDASHSAGHISFIGTLAEADRFDVTNTVLSGLWGSEGSFVDSASAVPLLGGSGGGDGHILVFASRAPLTSDDSDGGFRDVFRYDADTGTLQRISKAASGGSEIPPANATVNFNEESPSSNFAEQGRWVSEDGETIAFATGEPLTAGDSDGTSNPFVWKQGQLARLPGEGDTVWKRPVVSTDGSEVGFTSAARLLPQDGDSARDTYLVRMDGGFANTALPSPCDPLTEGACQGPATAPPSGTGPATPSFTGPGNSKVPSKCGKGKVQKNGKCVKKRHKKHKKHKGRASHKHGGSK